MSALTDTYTLYNGVKIPVVGFGTWQTPDGQTAVTSVAEALKVGYRHIDTAAAYGNEESVGQAIKESGIPREEIFVTTKLQNPEHGYENTLAAFDASMNKLGLDYLDLYLIHWPNPIKFREDWQAANAGTWKAFEELYTAGKIRSIGVSNFHPRHFDELMKTATIKPMVNQIRLCPGDLQPEVVAYCQENDILLEAYSPLGTGEIFKVDQLNDLATKYGKSIAQICLRWSLHHGFLPLPKSVTASRIKENSELFDFDLSPEDIAKIDELDGIVGYSLNPDEATF